jgi:NADPH-dependent glutamate synthase beta subunit-like oxidoreductase
MQNFEERPGSEREIPCELALLAMGFVHPQHDGLVKQLDIDLDERGNVKATEQSFQTNIPKIFTAGICAGASRWWSGPSVRAGNAPGKWMST